MKKIAISQLSDLFAKISAEQKLYIPADNKGQAQFLPYVEGLKLSESLNTVRSAKDLFFPQVENLLKFKVSGNIADLPGAFELTNVFLICATAEQTFIIPTRCMSKGEIKQLRALLAEGLGERFYSMFGKRRK